MPATGLFSVRTKYMLTIISTVVPIFVIILAGIIVEKLDFMPENSVRILSIFSINICFPCLLFHIMSSTPLDNMGSWRWWLGILAVQWLGFFILYFIEKMRGEKDKVAILHGLVVAFCNAGFVGLPIIMSVYNQDKAAISVAGVMIVASNTIVIVAQTMLVSVAAKEKKEKEGDAAREETQQSFLKKTGFFLRTYILSNGIFMGVLLGLAVSASGIRLWQPLDKALSMLGYISPTCMLFTLGLGLRPDVARALSTHSIHAGHQVVLILLRLAGLPLLTLLVLSLLNIDPLWISVSTIITATGCAIFTATLAQIYQADAGGCALTVSLTNILSIVSLSATLILLSHMGLLPFSLNL